MRNQPESIAGELKETSPACIATGEGASTGVDLSLLRASLAMTPWERMQANDDALNFGESLRAAMKKRNEQSQ